MTRGRGNFQDPRGDQAHLCIPLPITRPNRSLTRLENASVHWYIIFLASPARLAVGDLKIANLNTDIFRRQRSMTSGDTLFSIPDASPLIQYGDGNNSSWTSGYALQSDGYDQTLHLTAARDTISFNISGESHPLWSSCSTILKISNLFDVSRTEVLGVCCDGQHQCFVAKTGVCYGEWRG